MLIAAPTNYAIPYIKGPFFSDLPWTERSFRRLRGSGFSVFDWSSCDYARVFTSPEETPLVRDEWQDFAVALREMAMRVGVCFHQAHGLIYNPFDGSEQSAFLSQIEPRVFHVCKELGIHYVVKHPPVPPNIRNENDRAEGMRRSADYLRRLADIAAASDVYIAIENSYSLNGRWAMFNNPPALLELIDIIQRENVCVCLDVGHANIMGENLLETCKHYGSFLKCLHIQDNDGKSDQHRLPLHGTINWDNLFAGLNAIGYDGDFTLEAHPVLKASEMVRAHQEREAYLICQELLISNGKAIM